VPAIQEMARSFRKKASADVDFLNLVQDVSLSPDEEIQVFHIIQESLYNIAKHARARHVVITLDLEDGQYIVNVADDGVGVQKKNDESSSLGKSFGLTIMRERAARLNGNLKVESRLPAEPSSGWSSRNAPRPIHTASILQHEPHPHRPRR